MAIYEMTKEHLRKLDETSFGAARISERGDLQRLLRSQIDVIAPGLLVVTEEFGDWEDSRRRIDLLALDKDANLVVVELKRTEDGGHMELQAIRYAAMISAMTFDKVVEVYAAHLGDMGKEIDARMSILEFLGWTEPDEDRFAQDVRIVLVSAEFSKELTTAVLWLNDRDLDIRCIRIKPYQDGERVLIDVQQVIPLPEATDYMVKIREKEVRERAARKEQSGRDELHERFFTALQERSLRRTPLHANGSAGPKGLGGVQLAPGMALGYGFTGGSPRVSLYLQGTKGKSPKEFFDLLYAKKVEIESAFGGPLTWDRMDERERTGAQIVATVPAAPIQDESQWEALQDRLVDTMIRFEAALRGVVATLA